MAITGIAVPEQQLQLVDSQIQRSGMAIIRPPFVFSFRQTLLAQPEPLAVVHQRFDRGRSPVPEDEDATGKRVRLQNLTAYPSQPINPFPEVHRIH